MGMFAKSKREKELEKQNEMLKKMLAQKTTNKKSANTNRVKFITRQCKYCGYRIALTETGILPGGSCPKRKPGQPHVWQKLGYNYSKAF